MNGQQWCLLGVVFLFNWSYSYSSTEDATSEDVKKMPVKAAPPPYALSYVYVRHLAKVEEELYKILQNYEKVLQARLKIVSK